MIVVLIMSGTMCEHAAEDKRSCGEDEQYLRKHNHWWKKKVQQT